jgi:hypothetical protein
MVERLDEAREWAARRHTRLRGFAVVRFEWDGRYIHAEYQTLDAAQDAARAGGLSGIGRKPVIYALTPEGWAVEVEEVDPG